MAAELTLFQRAARWLAQKAAVGPTDVLGLYDGSWKPIVREPFSGAWQRNIALDLRGVTAFSAVYACINLRARDIGKLRMRLMQQDGNGIWSEVDRFSPLAQVLRKPNRYQTRIQFLEYWISSKLTYGNAYALKERDARGVVVELYPLDPRRVTTKVALDGSVWYDIEVDALNGVPQQLPLVPASEVIHDRCITLFHPLIGVSPIYAAGMSAAQGVKIQENSAHFFANMSAPSGHLSAPGAIQDVTAARLKKDFEEAKGGMNLGRVLVTGDGMKYEPFSMPAVDAQLIEQLRWTVEDVARCFGVPLHKLQAGAVPQVGNMGALNQDYYQQTLQEDIEAIEVLLDEGLELDRVRDKTYGVELDLEGLLRMDPKGRAEVVEIQTRSGALKPNEARAAENRGPVDGGDACYLQQQNFSLAALAKRDARDDPFATPKAEPATAPAEPPSAEDVARALEPLVRTMFAEKASSAGQVIDVTPLSDGAPALLTNRLAERFAA